MKIVTWNVNSLTARWPRVSEWVIAHEPDVVLIQETKQTDAKFPFADLAALGYDAAHYGQGQWNGVAVLSRVGIADVARGFGDEDPEARIIGATCAGVRVYSCYVPNGRALDDPHYEYKLAWLGRLGDLVEGRDRDEAFVVGGDFNVAPADLDCYDPAAFVGATHVSAPERAALERLERRGSRGPHAGAAPRRGDLQLVGLPQRRVPPRLGASHRPALGRRVRRRGDHRRATWTATRARDSSPRTTRRWSRSSICRRTSEHRAQVALSPVPVASESAGSRRTCSSW